ncbi:MAG: phosphoenolpyruvate carboxykinase (GTP), partial [Lentisphaeria bacterium]|nr:phosphoenolpyruvate carboxykinase (GTP) [Lentisphaeria bacterium]
ADDAIDRSGIEDQVSAADMAELLKVDVDGWRKELEMIEEHYAKFGDRLPAALKAQLAALKARLG